MPRKKKSDFKVDALRQQRTLHASPEQVRDELFVTHPFFDARDRLQVKYEMLRRVMKDGWTASRAARLFGFSRPSFYAAQKAMEDGGLPGLLAKKPGPQGAHKLTDDILEFVDKLYEEGPKLTRAEVLKAIETEFSKRVHRRSLERALGRREKERP